ncbi:MAG: hypothetical protein AAF708_17550 [Deinococcota bacterium]
MDWSILTSMNLERVALELLEYKTQDLVAGKSLTPGSLSIKALYSYLLASRAKLSMAERKRLMEVQKRLKARSQATKKGATGSADGPNANGLTRSSATASQTSTASGQAGGQAREFDLAALASEMDDTGGGKQTFGMLQEERRRSERAEGFELFGSFAAGDLEDGVQQDGVQQRHQAVKASPTLRRKITLSDQERQEQDTLKQLAQHVWWEGINQRLQNLAMTYRAEPNRHTVRLVYASLRNLTLYSKTPTFAKDISLEHFEVKKPLPDYSDPLLSLNDLESLTALLTDVVTTILEFKDPREPYSVLDIEAYQVMDYMRRVAQAVASDPYAGKLSLVPGKEVTSDQLRMAISQLEREALGEAIKREQREQFEARLKDALRHEQSQRELFEHDVALYKRAMNDFFDVLEGLLPQHVGGRHKTPQLAGGVLFAENPALRLDKVPPDAKSITMQLKGPTRFQLAGFDVAITGSVKGWHVLVKGTEKPLESPVTLDLEGARLYVFEKNNYVHAVIQHHDRPLQVLIAESLAVYQILRTSQDKTFANILATATGITPDSSESARQVVRRLSELSNNAPERRDAISGFIRGAARVVQQTPDEDATNQVITSLQRVFDAHDMQLADVVQDIDPQRTALYTLGSKPVKVNVAGQPLTVRKYQARVYGHDLPESIVVMAPGRPLGSFNDYMLQPLSGGMALFIRASHELAILHLPF